SDATVNANNVTLHFTSPQYTSLSTILGHTYVLKASVAAQVAQNPTMTIKVPVGTGPFMLASYSSSLIKWKPNPSYWGGTPPESESTLLRLRRTPRPATRSSAGSSTGRATTSPTSTRTSSTSTRKRTTPGSRQAPRSRFTST